MKGPQVLSFKEAQKREEGGKTKGGARLRLQNSSSFTGQTAEDSGQGRTCRFHFS